MLAKLKIMIALYMRNDEPTPLYCCHLMMPSPFLLLIVPPWLSSRLSDNDFKEDFFYSFFNDDRSSERENKAWKSRAVARKNPRDFCERVFAYKKLFVSFFIIKTVRKFPL